MSWQVCNEPGCPELVENAGECEVHRKERRRKADRRRPNAAQRGYGAAWRKSRVGFLAYFPTCIDCGQPATVPDHDPVPRAELVRRGDPDPDAWHHLKPRCGRCHNRRTGREEGLFAHNRYSPLEDER